MWPLFCIRHTLIRPQRRFLSLLPSSLSKIIKTSKPQPVPQPPFNPRYPPDYIPSQKGASSTSASTVPSQSSIIARFRHAYAKYGKILLVVHFVASFAWFSGLLIIHFNGCDIGMYVINGLAQIKILTAERRESLLRRMNEFSIAGILSRIPFLSQNMLDRLNAYWTGERVRLLATVLILYKLLSPLRYAFTLGVTTYLSRTFLKRGIIQRAPKGDSLQELYRDQKQLIKSHVRRARDKMKKSARRGGGGGSIKSD